jgi:hypothetical protein
MKLKSLKQFESMSREYADLPESIQKKMMEMDGLLDEQENGDDGETLKDDINALDEVILNELQALDKEEEESKKEEEQAEEVEKEEADPIADELPSVDLAKANDNIAENDNEPSTKSESSPYFWMQS